MRLESFRFILVPRASWGPEHEDQEASWSSCSGHQEALGTRMLLILRERNFPNAKWWRKQVIKRLKGILSFSDQERALPGAHKLALHPSTEISVLAFNCEKKLQQLSGVSTFKE